MGVGASLVRRVMDAVNDGRLHEVATELIANDFVRHDLAEAFPTIEGAEGASDLIAAVQSAFPDHRIEIIDLFESEDRVTMRYISHGTHRGEFLGVPPTGKFTSVNGINIYRIQDGKIAETWQLLDYSGFFRQLGMSLRPPASGE